MGLAYGATAPGETGNAARIGIIVGPDGVVRYAEKVSARNFPAEALAVVRGS